MNAAKADSELINETLTGDMAAFRTLVERHEGKVAGVVKGLLGDVPEADDVGQEVFIRLYESLASFRGDAALGTYVTRIAINLSLNELKRQKRKATRFGSLREAEEKETASADDALHELLHREIENLEPDYRTVVILRMIEGYSVQETAALLNVPVGTVMSRLHRAQKKLKETITKQKGND
ncbi:MAG: RNA polymerase sigma factor [Bacteroidota bacterium]